MNYVLVDYENVQPADISVLRVPNVQLLLFVGASQTKLPIEMVMALQSMNGAGRIVRCSATGSNALDFHVAFYCGEIAAQDKEAYLHIVSRDKGFDPLIAHLKERKVPAQRVASLVQISFLKVVQTKSLAERTSLVLERLQKGATKPRSLKTLGSTISTIFHKSLSEAEIEAIVEELQRRQSIVLDNGKLTYSLDGK